jgi:leucyl-tRNA synthetase
MFDRGFVPKDEFAKKLINQGMITGTSAFVYRVGSQELSLEEDFHDSAENRKNHLNKKFPVMLFSQAYLGNKEEMLKIYQASFDDLNIGLTTKFFGINPSPIHTDVSLVNSSDELDMQGFKKWQPDYNDAEFVLEDSKYIVGREVEKMSKSKYNVVNPDNIVADYGADSLRLYEMFLGPLEQSKPWNTAGITGVYGFLKKLWKLYFDENGSKITDAEASAENLKTLHNTIKKVEEDIENFSFNTSVSTFMICVNELTAQKCTSKAILGPLALLISPYAPHIAEELWNKLGNTGSISTVDFPIFEPEHLVESNKVYPISFNGKMKFTMELSLDLLKDDIEAAVMAHEKTQQQLAGRIPKKVIVVPGKIVNIVG